ncbi:pyrroloquinoline quinone biosynthesis peptide chaperone PqqD [Streptomyces indonesiensis]
MTGPGPGTGPAPTGWRPALAPAVSLRHDRVRDADLLVLPERVVVLRGSAAKILRLCDGDRDLDAIVAELRAASPARPSPRTCPPSSTGCVPRAGSGDRRAPPVGPARRAHPRLSAALPLLLQPAGAGPPLP